MTLGQILGKGLKKCVDNNGMFLFATAALGWILASTAQTIGLITNKKITKEEKKFLVPQEIADGVFNIVSYAAVTLPLMGMASKFAKGRYGDEAAEGAKTIAAIAGGAISSNIITPLLRNKTSVAVKNKMEKSNLKPVAPEIYDGKTFPNFQSRTPLSMNSYINFTKSLPRSGSLKI